MIIKRQLPVITLLVFVICLVGSCASLSEHQRREYGTLESAVTFSADKVIGEYGNSIPDDFSAEKFMGLVKDKIPKNYYEALKKHRLEVRAKGAYYLLLIFVPETNSLILFDYSCTPEVDGPVLLSPGKYNLDRLELYDKCNGN